MKRVVRRFLAAWLACAFVTSPVLGQVELGTVLKKHFKLRSVSCNSCHVKELEEKSKEDLTPFGLVIAKLVEDQKITERLDAVKDLEEEKELVKEAIEREFAETVKKLDTMKDAHGKSYPELIQAGEIEGLKPQK